MSRPMPAVEGVEHTFVRARGVRIRTVPGGHYLPNDNPALVAETIRARFPGPHHGDPGGEAPVDMPGRGASSEPAPPHSGRALR